MIFQKKKKLASIAPTLHGDAVARLRKISRDFFEKKEIVRGCEAMRRI
jgi:hypothetical protein